MVTAAGKFSKILKYLKGVYKGVLNKIARRWAM